MVGKWLFYQPESDLKMEETEMSLDQIAIECKKIFETEQSENLNTIFQMGASSGGARPKIFYQIDGEEWIVKFPSSIDRNNIGKEEYQYSLCARNCGLYMPETKLLPSKLNTGYFAVKRFDRKKEEKIHMVSVSGLLETSHRIPNLDYHTLMRLTMIMTKSYEEIEKMYRLICFNVFVHNRDDYSKNFSFIYTGEHATTINGNGRYPNMEDLLAVGERIKFDKEKARQIAENIKEIVLEDLREYI